MTQAAYRDDTVILEKIAHIRRPTIVVSVIALLWIISDFGYYALLPWLGFEADYNRSPVAISLFYAFWAVTTFYIFRGVFLQWNAFENRQMAAVLTLGIVAVTGLFVVYAIPLLPPVYWNEPSPAPDLLFATPWYFLPKSTEILFQQLLVAALVLSFYTHKYHRFVIGLWVALLFGGVHLLLYFSDVPQTYVLRFTVAGTIFGLLVPYLMLSIKNGFAYSYLVVSQFEI